jgi:AcrR family transcriptional regulator
MPRGFTEQEKERIRARLVDAARDHLERLGPGRTRVEDLTRAAGISKGAFYIFYGSREELFFAVLERFEAGFREEMRERAARTDAPPAECLREMLRFAVAAWQRHPLFRHFGTADFEALLRGLPEEKLREHLRGDEAMMEGLLDELRARGVEVRGDARLLTGLVRALFFVALHGEELGEDVYPDTMDVLTGLVAGYVAGEGAQ